MDNLFKNISFLMQKVAQVQDALKQTAGESQDSLMQQDLENNDLDSVIQNLYNTTVQLQNIVQAPEDENKECFEDFLLSLKNSVVDGKIEGFETSFFNPATNANYEPSVKQELSGQQNLDAKEDENIMKGCVQDVIRESLTHSLLAFLVKSFEILNPEMEYSHNWHIEEICDTLINLYLNTVDNKNLGTLDVVSSEELKRVAISMPPRYLKSIIVSVVFPAWVFTQDPTKRIIVASYSMQISNKLSADTRKIMQSKWFCQTFPHVQIARGENQKNRFETTKGGFRLAVSTGGSLTGEGGDILIVDDPHKPIDVMSNVKRRKVIEWFEGTFSSRLNNKKRGAIIVMMQRLHETDLIGYLQEKQPKLWKFIEYKAIDEAGNPLHNARENLEDLKQIQEQMGEDAFMAQYMQRPRNLGKGLIDREKIQIIEYDSTPEDICVVSIDSANKTGANNDFTAITVWNMKNKGATLMEAFKLKLEFEPLVQNIQQIINDFAPRFLLVEDASSGTQIIQKFRSCTSLKVVGIKPKEEKIIRFSPAIVYMERGFIKFSKKANMLNEVITEMINFPFGKHDDFIDSISQFVNWREIMFGRFGFTPKPPPNIRRL